MASKYSYKFTEKAMQDLNDILHYIKFDLANPTAAANLGRKTFESIDTITAFPESGLLVNNEYLSDKSIRRILVNNYILYYKVIENENMIYIVRIVYGKRNLDDILKNI